MIDRRSTLIVYQAPWNWDFLWNRAQPLAVELSKHSTVVYLDIGLSELSAKYNFFKKMPFASWASRGIGVGKLWKLSDRLYRYYNFHTSYDGWHILKNDRSALGYKILKEQLRPLIQTHRRVWLMTSRCGVKGLLDLYPWDKVIVDIEDPWLSLACAPSLDALRGLLSRADAVFSNGIKLARAYQSYSEKEIHSLPNGIGDDFLKLFETSWPCPSWIEKGNARKRALYAGHINNRIDFVLLEKVISECPSFDFFFVGLEGVTGSVKSVWEKIKTKKNVYVQPAVVHREIPAAYQHADVLLLPYAYEGGMEMFPAKVFEYLAAGKPILSGLDFSEELGDVPGLVHCAAADDYLQSLSRINSGESLLCSEDKKAQRNLAAGNSWKARVETFFRCVENQEACAA